MPGVECAPDGAPQEGESGVIEEPEETLEDEDDEEAAAPVPAEEPSEASLDELIAKKADEPSPEEEAEEALLGTGREDRVEALSVKVVPQQPTEFTCRNCYLVKHRSQLADKKRMFCRDCA